MPMPKKCIYFNKHKLMLPLHLKNDQYNIYKYLLRIINSRIIYKKIGKIIQIYLMLNLYETSFLFIKIN